MNLIDYNAAEPTYTTTSAWRVTRDVASTRQGRNRKGAKARTWTDAEERYLIESRNQRVQYKRIAARLQKSELACRLHYHQLTKHRPSVDVEMCYSDDFDSTNITPRPSPSCSSNLTISPPTTHEGMEQLKLPSLTALLDEPAHRRSTSLPGSLPVPVAQSQRQLTPPTYILPPPRRLLSPFDESRAMQAPADSQRYHLPPPNDPHSHFRHQRAVSMTSLSDNMPYAAPGSTVMTPYYDPPRRFSPMGDYSPTPSGDRCSVNNLLNHHGSFTI